MQIGGGGNQKGGKQPKTTRRMNGSQQFEKMARLSKSGITVV